jgi:predicted DNA-binding transcriptional regulator YafY
MSQENALHTFCRRMEILNFLKTSKQLRSVAEITEHLVMSGLLAQLPAHDTQSAQAQQRKVQRDLKFLSSDTGVDEEGQFNEFGLISKPGIKHSNQWGIEQDIDADFSWASMPDHMAVTLALAEKHLAAIMPSRYHQLLSKHYQTARNKLSQASKKYQPKQLEKLLQSVVIEQRGLRLEAAKIDEQILDNIYEALILNRQLRIRYKNKTVIVHPYGVVIAQPKIYLIAMKEDEQDLTRLRSYLLHRISQIELMKLSARQLPGFDLSEYVAQGQMEMKIDNDHSFYALTIELNAPPGSNLIRDLQETPITSSQSLVAMNDNRYLLKARVQRSFQLINWILSLGASATVLEPIQIRQDIIKNLQAVRDNYHPGKDC